LGIPSKNTLILGLQRKEIISLCSKLIQLRSENPPGDTREIAEYIKQKLENSGYTCQKYEPIKNMENLVATIGSDKPNLIFCGHLDVFPAGFNWRLDPFSGKVIDGKIFGRGAVDMKAGLAAAISAFETIAKYEKEMQGRLTLALFADEENMGFGGAQWMLKNVHHVRGDACLIGEPAAPDVVTIGEKGVLWLRYEAEGELAHGAYTGGENAINKATEILKVLENLKKYSGRAPSEITTLVRKQRNYYQRHGLPKAARALEKVWYNCGVIKGGERINMVPQRCEVYVDVRLPMGVKPIHVITKLNSLIKQRGLSNLRHEVLFSIEPNFTSPTERIVEVTKNNVEQLLKKPAKLFFRLGSTDGKFFRKAGIPTVTYGPNAQLMGRINEFVHIEELMLSVGVHVGVAYDYLYPK